MLSEMQIRKIFADTNPKIDWSTQDKDVSFQALGLDSLDRFDLLVAVQEATGVEIPDSAVEKLQSIASIEAYFSEK